MTLHRRRHVAPGAAAALATALLALGLTGTMLSGLQALGLLAEHPLAFAAALVLATATAVPYTAFLLWLDRNEQEPPALLAAAWTWGALAATSWAGLGNGLGTVVGMALTGDPVMASTLTATLVAPVTEETLKALALLGLFTVFPRETDNALDGLIYGAMVGMGFAWFENITYYVSAAEDGPGAVLALALARGVFSGVGSHATFTALTGAAFGISRLLRRRGAWWLVPPLGLSTAIFAHFLWNALSGLFLAGAGDAALWLGVPLAVLALQLPFMALLGLVLLLSWRHENDLIRTWLGREPSDIVGPADLERLVPARRRLAGEAAELTARGPSAWWASRQLGRALVRLAFERWHHAEDGLPWAPEHDEAIMRWRERVRRLRGAGARIR